MASILGGSAPLWRYEDARVVVVDDVPERVEAVHSLLRSAGLRDVHAVDADRATHGLATLDPDLVILGLLQRRAAARAVLDHTVREAATSFLPVLALTDGSTELTHRVLAQGARDIVAVPLHHAEVVRRVGNLLETRTLYKWQRQIKASDLTLAALHPEPAVTESARQALCDTILLALSRHAFHMVFQPVQHCSTGLTVGYEALARFHIEPQHSPAYWFANAGKVGLGYALELNALSLALDEMRHLSPNAFLSVNISAETLLHPGVLAVADPSIAPRLVLELTQHQPIEDYGALCQPLARLRSRGVRLALDDTGAGYESLRHMRTLAPDIIKLKADLVRGIDRDPVKRALTAALVSFADELQTDLVAKGVETPSELATLTGLGVRFAQGHLLGSPRRFP